MTVPPLIRIFFAIDPPGSVKEQIGRYISSLKKASKAHAIRWSRVDHLHITLQFLPEVQEVHLERLVNAVRANLQKATALTLSFTKPYLFPSPYRPRVIALDVAPEAALLHLANVIGQGIEVAHYAVEQRPFHAHLTLGRIKHPEHFDSHFLSAIKQDIEEQFAIDEIVLFRSDPKPEGSQYTVLERMGLTK